MQDGILILETDARALQRFDESTTRVEFLLGPSCPLGVPVLVPLAFHLFCFYCDAVLVVCVPFPFCVWGRVWNSIVSVLVSVPDHCLFIYLGPLR